MGRDRVVGVNGHAGFGSSGDPQDWRDFVLSVKGDPNNVAILSLVGPSGADACPPLNKTTGTGIDGAEEATRILQFTGMFPFGFVGPVCASNYNSFFTEAVDVVDEACTVFVPPQG